MVDDQSTNKLREELSTLHSTIDETTTTVEADLGELDAAIDGHAVTAVQAQLTDLQTAIDRLPSPEPPPQTTLQLQHRADVEAAWQNYLRYFLDPTANHGLGPDALRRFLRGLDGLTVESVPTRLSDDIVVDDEVSSPNENRPDIVIQEPGEFFICCELKLYSPEGQSQTERYADDDYIGSTPKREFPDQGHHYVYIRRPGEPIAAAPAFVNATWSQVQDWLRPLVVEHHGRYPSRTIAQLTDFLDTITQDMTQDEHIQTAQEKMRLYFAHKDAIREAKQGFDTAYEYEVNNWRRRFLDSYLPENWGVDWETNSSRYGQIYHQKWRQDENLALEDGEIEMHFVHLIRDKESFEEGKLTMQLRWPGDSAYRDRFKELFVSDRFAETLDPALAEHGIRKQADYSYNNPRFIEKVYSVDRSELPDSYYETLQVAVREHIELAPAINEILETTIEDVETAD